MFKAKCVGFPGFVAAKLLSVEHESEAVATRMLNHEVRTLASLSHPTIIQ
jgi:hypothetical protein